MRSVIKGAREKVIITVIDTGMVITLDDKDRENFLGFIKNVIQGNGKECANQIYKLSSYGGRKLESKEFPRYA